MGSMEMNWPKMLPVVLVPSIVLTICPVQLKCFQKKPSCDALQQAIETYSSWSNFLETTLAMEGNAKMSTFLVSRSAIRPLEHREKG